MPSLANAKVGNNTGRKLPDGEHVIDVQDVRIYASQQYRTDFFIVEFVVVETTSSAVEVGGLYSWSRPFTDQYGHGPNDIKEWICFAVEKAVPGSNPATQWDDGFIAWIAPDEPAVTPVRGMRLHVGVWSKGTKSGHSIAVHDWQVLEPGASRGLAPAQSSAPTMPQPTPAPAFGVPAMPQTPAQPQAPAAPSIPVAPPATPQPQVASQPPPGWPASMPWPGSAA